MVVSEICSHIFIMCWRVAKYSLICCNPVDTWTRERRLKYLGVPKYFGTGRHVKNGQTYRFMVMPRFSTDLQKLFVKSQTFLPQTVMALSLRMVRAGGFADVPTSDCHGTRSTNGKGWWVSMVRRRSYLRLSWHSVYEW